MYFVVLKSEDLGQSVHRGFRALLSVLYKLDIVNYVIRRDPCSDYEWGGRVVRWCWVNF